ncbi:hypothetical protein [Roseibium polysiphoniae]|uniref:Uncharacterized protein n=1 Tax=Roseibium polysiphoniae TaxID=2571221 RepID=A0ABR9CGV8_9HYPH|nr:hypothetical protein [Roseibium polysiphoniae]MBD8878405.1 hypothetical protein [Roseibium polysiphoniae]
MVEAPKKPGRLSTGRNKALRSRGFLSHGSSASQQDAKPKRSSGTLRHGEVNDASPRELDAPKPRRPYSLDEK